MEKQEIIDTLNELLQGEHMAIHIYDKTKYLQGDDQVKNMLQRFQQDHERHASQLSQRIQELGGEPIASTGLSGTMSNIMGMVNAIRGPEHLIEQVYQGEDMGFYAYEKRLYKVDPESQELLRNIMWEDNEHLSYFRQRIEQEERE